MYEISDVAIAEIPDDQRYQAIAVAAARLLVQVVGSESLDYLADEMKEQDAHTIVAVEKTGRVIGASLIYMDELSEEVYLDEIGVLPGYQGRGVGSSMMRVIESLARDKGKKAIELTPVSAHGFYSAHGFEITGNTGQRQARKNLG